MSAIAAAASNNSDGNIQVFLRIRPSKKSSNYFSILEENGDAIINVHLPDHYKSDYVNNSQVKYAFHFNGVIDMGATQEEVFERVGLAAVQNALDGFNSTIFAYGQTGSGKTFTLTGGPERYADRGIIPRSISLLFNSFRKRSDVQMKAYISYLEIYQGDGYDLLDPSHETKALEDLPKVRMLEDDHGNFLLKNLSMHIAETEETALNLLFLGDTNRAIAETPMNMASSRSHCVFTISLEIRQVGAEVVRRSKLHLVDLAGSERVAKTNSSGSVLAEAKYINTSLFFLEMVIVALYEKATKGRTHVPYRNSLMTMMLKDSLGGNCKTIMIATINPEANQTDESLSTCRFAQRVSLIKNKATINEDMDPSLVIARLKAEILTLREEIAFLKDEAGEGDILTPTELEDLRTKCRDYVNDPDPNRDLSIGKLTLNKIKRSFFIFKELYRGDSRINSPNRAERNRGSDNTVEDVDSSHYMKQIKDLKSLLLQRDNEIAILVGMVKSGKGVDDVVHAERVKSSGGGGGGSAETSSSGTKTHRTTGKETSEEKQMKEVGVSSVSNPQLQREQQRENRIIQRHLFGIAPPEDKTLLEDPAASFEWFRLRHELNNSIEENKIVLRDKYNEAKVMGERANQSRNTINYLKNSIEAIRREKAIQGTLSREPSEGKDAEEEETYRRAIEQEKLVYKESFEKLRTLKPEIEHIKMLLEKGRSTLQQQFDQWYNSLYSRQGVILTGGSSNAGAKSTVPTHNAVPSPRRSSVDSGSFALSEPKSSPGKRSSFSAASSKTESSDVNEDILAFYQAKEELLKRRGK